MSLPVVPKIGLRPAGQLFIESSGLKNDALDDVRQDG
jgi:hypothetical protein